MSLPAANEGDRILATDIHIQMVPTKGLGSGVGMGPPGLGTSWMWMSVARMRSPSFAAGRLMVACPRWP